MNILNIFNPDIAFDGWGVSIILFLLSAFGVGAWYKTKHKIRQKQKSGNNANLR